MIKKILLIGMIIVLVLISGCSSIYRYNQVYASCIENNPNQNEYCQCWASCYVEPNAVGKDCHLRCKGDWEVIHNK